MGLVVHWLGGSVALALSYLVPALAAPVAVWAAAVVTGRRVLAITAVGAALWVVGSFYYWIGMPLLTKAYILGGLGIALGAGLWLSGHARLAPFARNNEPSPTTGFRAIIPIALVFVSLSLTVGLASNTISANEEIIQNGRRIFIALAPCDPRSLVQGDYMVLRFAAPRSRGRTRAQRPMWAVATVDERDVAEITSFETEPRQSGASSVSFKITWQNLSPIIGTNAFYFKEGTARQYSGARFGEFRLGASGDIVLIGLADETLKRLGRATL